MDMRTLLLLTAATAAFAQTTPVITFSLATPVTRTAWGSTAAVGVSMTAATAPAAVQFTFGWPTTDASTATFTLATPLAASKQVSCGPIANGQFICIIYGLNLTTIPNGSLGTLNLTLVAAPPDLSATLNLSNGLGADPAANGLTTSTASALVTIKSPCDLNGDGTINLADLLAEAGEIDGLAACTDDINKDGVCNALDMIRIVIASQVGGVCKVGP